MKKKITRISAIVFILLLALFIGLPYVIESKAADLLKDNVNKNIKGQFNFADLSMSLYSDFPYTRISLKQVSLVNTTPFSGDTLFSAASIDLKMGISEFFEGVDDPIEIDELLIDSALLSLKIDSSEVANYDISRTGIDGEPSDNNDPSPVLSVRSYSINNSRVSYRDLASGYYLELDKLNHQGSGDFSEAVSRLQTKTDGLVSFSMDKTQYLDKNNLSLESLIEIDLDNNLYGLKEGQATINRLPLSLDGTIQILEDGQQLDLSFSTVSSDFKNFLALIPEKYSKDISQLRTRGSFDLAGECRGMLSEETIPQFNIQLTARDASFKYPDLPKGVENIDMSLVLKNETGIAENTAIEIENASFRIDNDLFQLKALITQLTGNTGIQSNLKGSLNLGNLAQAYPVPSSLEMQGLLQGELNSAFQLSDIENKDYKKIELDGVVDISGLNYAFEALPHPLKIHTLRAELNPRTIEIGEVAGITGSTDFSANGKLRNALGYLFNDEVLRGNFEMRSNSFVVADLIQEGEENSGEAEEEAFKVPAYLDLNLNAIVGKAIYDNIVLYDLAGNLRIKDEVITFKEISSRMLDGRMIFDGMLSTRSGTPSFEMALDMSRLNIASTFETIEVMKLLGPAASALDGKLNSKMSLSGNLTDQLDLNMNSLTGNMLAEILTATVDTKKTPVTNLLNTSFEFVDMDKIDLAGLKTSLSFDEGQVKVKPFKLRYEDVAIEFSGGHSFAHSLDYQLTFDVPARYMGEDVNRLLANMQDESLEEITVPVVAKLEGTYSQPKLRSDMKAQARELTEQLVEIQKQKYINKGKKEVTQAFGDMLAGKKEETEAPVTDSTKSGSLENLLQSPFEKTTDSGQTTSKEQDSKDVLKEGAKSILGGLLGSKNRAISTKDTVN